MTNAEAFAARLARIEQGGPNTKNTIFIGQDEQHDLGKKVFIKQSKSREIAGNAAYPLSLIGAFVLGLVAVALSFYARFQVMQGEVHLDDPGLEMALSGGLGIALSFVLAQMFRLTSKEHKGMQSAGVFVMVCALHNLAHWAPGPMAVVFSSEWVQRVQTDSPPNSARLGGGYFPLFKTASADVAAPVQAEPGMAPETAILPAAEITCPPAKPAVKMIEMNNAKKKKPGKTATAPCEGG